LQVNCYFDDEGANDPQAPQGPQPARPTRAQTVIQTKHYPQSGFFDYFRNFTPAMVPFRQTSWQGLALDANARLARQLNCATATVTPLPVAVHDLPF
jgi:hypothetical protein